MKKQPKKRMEASFKDDRRKGNFEFVPEFLKDCKCFGRAKADHERKDKPNE